jgi:hypothetical protein
MKTQTKIPITDPMHLIDMGRTHGLLIALETLENIKGAERLTGVGVAIHALKAAEAEQRVQTMQKNIRAAVKAGVDIDTHHILWQGKPEIIAERMDLADQGSDI